MLCQNCGEEITSQTIFCPWCGRKISDIHSSNYDAPICCPQCGSRDVSTSVYQENKSGRTFTKTKSRYHEKGHGCLWWLLIGCWWWIFDLMFWIFFFPIRLVIQLFKKRKYSGNSSSVTHTQNKVTYQTVFLCKSCGHNWKK